jgi:uncharacterized membrane protein
MRLMKKYFLTGLASLLPVAVTIWLVSFVVDFLTRPFIGFVTKLISHNPVTSPWASEHFIRIISQILILLTTFLFILFLGVVAHWFFFNTVLKIGDYIFRKIPLINKVYKMAKEIINILFTSSKNSFKQVVMVKFPNKNCYCIGLITREAPKTCCTAVSDELISIFIPTTPNPTTGFLIISPKSDVIYLDMKSDEAVKYVVSCGVILPGKL